MGKCDCRHGHLLRCAHAAPCACPPLQKIAAEKAGILKRGRPGFTVPQLEEAMQVLKVSW